MGLAVARPRVRQQRVVPAHLAALHADLMDRLQGGDHVLLFGARGTGKSTFLAALRDECEASDIPCALCPQTQGLADLVDAFSRAYPDVDTSGLRRRAIATRLRLAADGKPGILLLDHVREVTTAMIGFLRQLRGGPVAILCCVDADAEFERERLLGWRRHALCARMPLMPNPRLRRLLLRLSGAGACGQAEPGANVAESARSESLRGQLEPAALTELICAARGRVGWIVECARRIQLPEYWSDARFHLGALRTDTEFALRQKQGPRFPRR